LLSQNEDRGVISVPEQTRSEGARFLLVVAAFVIVVAGMRAAVSILVPFLLAAFIAIICAPLLFWLKRMKIPGPLALLIVIVGILGIGASMGVLIGASLGDFSAAVPTYQIRLQEETKVILTWLKGMDIEVSEQVIFEYFNPGAVMRFVGTSLTTISSGLTNAFFILLTVIFILLEVSSFPVKLRAILGDSHPSLANFDKVIGEVKHYLSLKTLTSLATGVAIAVWLAALGVDYPLLWGLLAFMLNFVPNIGSIIAAIPAILLALIQLGLGSAVLTAIAFLVVNFAIGFFAEPRLMGYRMGLSTLVVFLSLIFWGWVLGPIGMLLSVPLTMTVKIALQSNESTRWMAILLGSQGSVEVTPKIPSEKSKTDRPETGITPESPSG